MHLKSEEEKKKISTKMLPKSWEWKLETLKDLNMEKHSFLPFQCPRMSIKRASWENCLFFLHNKKVYLWKCLWVIHKLNFATFKGKWGRKGPNFAYTIHGRALISFWWPYSSSSVTEGQSERPFVWEEEQEKIVIKNVLTVRSSVLLPPSLTYLWE